MSRNAMDFGLVTGGLLKAALPKVAGAIATAVKHTLHPTELEKALKVGLQKSGALDWGQRANNELFYRCNPGDVDKFLAALLEHPEVQRELQKPLEQDGAPDVDMLVQAAKHVAAAQPLALPDEPLKTWLKDFANAYFNAITAIRFQVAKADYLEQLVNWFDDVQFLGVALDRHEETKKQLAQIFVMPDVEEDAGARSRLAFERSLFEEQGEQGRQGELLQEQRWRAQLERSGRKFSARQLLQQHQKKIVLLGTPGSGKTTLMSFFAVEMAERQGAIAPASDVYTEELSAKTKGLSAETTALSGETIALRPDTIALSAETKGLSGSTIALSGETNALRLDATALQTDAEGLLPILIRIRDWARTPDVTIPGYARHFAETTMSCKPLPKGFFEHWLNNGRALILLDGLDEVAEEAKRYHLVQCIENFLGQYPQNRAIITSRPAGYKRDFFRTEEFPHYELQPFDDGKIEEFCDRWYRSRVQDTAEALRRKESLQKALNQQDRIKLLARNPLLLTIIALIHRYQARLPRERYKLYDKAVETLLTAWDDNKELSNQTVLKYLQLDDLRRLMESLAYWIHTQGNTGDTEGGTLIDKDELIQKLCQEIKTLKQLKQYEAKAEAERFVRFIRDRTGLLNEQGQDCYAFVHKTFQEYLAAQDINYQADNEDDFEIVLTHINQHLHDPHWREVLLLLIAQQSPKKAARAIRKVLTANSPYEQWLHRDLFFAGRCLAEDPKGLRNADSSLPSEILELLVDLAASDVAQVGNKIYYQISQTICSLSETEFESQTLQLLKGRSESIELLWLLMYRAELGDEKAVIEELLVWCEEASKEELITILVNIEEYLPKSVMRALPSYPEIEDESYYVETHVAKAAVTRGYLLEGKDNSLASQLSTKFQERKFEPYDSVDWALNRSINQSSHDLVEVVDGLLHLLQREDPRLRSSGVYALSKLDNASDRMIQALLELFQDKDLNIRSEVTLALGTLGKRTESVLPTIVQWIEQHQDEECVGAGIDALWEIVEGV